MNTVWRALSIIGRAPFYHRCFHVKITATSYLVESRSTYGEMLRRIGCYGVR